MSEVPLYLYCEQRPLSLKWPVGSYALQGYLAHKKQPPPLGPPQEPRHGPTVGSYGGAGSYERGAPVPYGPTTCLGPVGGQIVT